MLINTKDGWKRLSCDHARPGLPTQHPAGFNDDMRGDWKKLGYPTIDLFLEEWGKSIHNNSGYVRPYVEPTLIKTFIREMAP